LLEAELFFSGTRGWLDDDEALSDIELAASGTFPTDTDRESLIGSCLLGHDCEVLVVCLRTEQEIAIQLRVIMRLCCFLRNDFPSKCSSVCRKQQQHERIPRAAKWIDLICWKTPFLAPLIGFPLSEKLKRMSSTQNSSKRQAMEIKNIFHFVFVAVCGM
jgi:hypothetical protein